MFKPFHDTSQDEADANTAHGEIREAQDAGTNRWVLAVDYHRNREFKSQQAGRIIEQTFAFEQVNDTLWQPDALGDGRGGNRVCCGYGGA